MKTVYCSPWSILATIIAIIFCLSRWGSSPSPPSYAIAIKEGQLAAQKLIDQHEASAISIALVDANQIIWSQSFGFADPIAGKALTENTKLGIGSVSKVIAAIAVMKLVDQGIINIDAPLVSYLPAFKMATEGYEKITVRMLLNHSAGFPGTDYRNAFTRTAVPGYPDQVLRTLSQSRLKAPAGYMNSYCNDCFTVIEALIQAKTGKQYSQFVKDEILIPLNMKNTSFPSELFPADSYAKAIKDGVLRPQEFMNSAASGGIYSTANDMANIAMMFLGAGTVGKPSNDKTVELIRIINETSVTEMAKDQTLLHPFNPVHSNSWAFGLGWDTVSQPGLLAVGFDGWGKGGDTNDYGAQLIVSPKAGLGIVVIGASGFGSEKAKILAERVLLSALAENNKIPIFVFPLKADEQQVNFSANAASPKINGIYAADTFMLKLDNAQEAVFSDTGWVPMGKPMQALNDGWFVSAENPLTRIKLVSTTLLGEPSQYVIRQSASGYGHYLDSSVFAEKIQDKYPKLSSAWLERLPLTWLVVNENPDELTWNGMDPRLRLTSVPEREGLIAMRPPIEPNQFWILDPSQSDTEARMMLIIPHLNGRDLNDLSFTNRNGIEWARLGSYMHQPLSSVLPLLHGEKQTIIIGAEGYADWRAVGATINPVQIILTTTGSWRFYDAKFNSLAYGKGNGVISLPPGTEPGYLTLFGTVGQAIIVEVL